MPRQRHSDFYYTTNDAFGREVQSNTLEEVMNLAVARAVESQKQTTVHIFAANAGAARQYGGQAAVDLWNRLGANEPLAQYQIKITQNYWR